MANRYVCEYYETPYDEGYRKICDLEEHDKKIYTQALEDFANKLKSKPYWDDEHNFQAIPIDFIDEVLDEMKR